jgi:hypothetical protein
MITIRISCSVKTNELKEMVIEKIGVLEFTILLTVSLNSELKLYKIQYHLRADLLDRHLENNHGRKERTRNTWWAKYMDP